MSDAYLDKRMARIGKDYKVDGDVEVGEDNRLPTGTLKKMETAYERFWAKRGMKVPDERWRSRGMRRGERGVA